jgi:hypothetical protein
MQLGALCSLVEVGVGLNLAFGVVQQFRLRLNEHLKRVTLSASLRIQVDLQNALAKVDAANARIAVASADADAINEAFDSFTTRHQEKFVILAVVASVLLVISVPGLAWFGTHDCGVCPLILFSFLALAPVGLWGGILICRYAVARFGLFTLRREHERDLKAYNKLSVHPKKPTP